MKEFVKTGLKADSITRIEKGMLRWFGHVERMDERRLTKRIYELRVSGSMQAGHSRNFRGPNI
jgi:hypothetical protein